MKPSIILFIFVLIASKMFAIDDNKIHFSPVSHASFVIQKGNLTIFVDPVSDYEKYKAYPTPQFILITHDHGDHFNATLLSNYKNEKTVIVAPKIVVQNLGYGKTISNGENINIFNVEIEAVPMYNTTPDRLMFHPKSVGNGYVLTIEYERIYISGDTEDIPEMRQLKNIDYAFICMNIPYTMTAEQAASAVLEFKPKQVYPYHYRQKDGFSDIEKFKKLVFINPNIKVDFLKWY